MIWWDWETQWRSRVFRLEKSVYFICSPIKQAPGSTPPLRNNCQFSLLLTITTLDHPSRKPNSKLMIGSDVFDLKWNMMNFTRKSDAYASPESYTLIVLATQIENFWVKLIFVSVAFPLQWHLVLFYQSSDELWFVCALFESISFQFHCANKYIKS